MDSDDKAATPEDDGTRHDDAAEKEAPQRGMTLSDGTKFSDGTGFA